MRTPPSIRPPSRAARRRASSFFTVLCATVLGACSDVTAPAVTPAEAGAGAAPTMAVQTATNIQFGDFALHVPAGVQHVRGILLAIGGPNTRGFALGTPFGAPPAVEASLQELGAMFRELAAERGLAILGSGRFGPTAYPNSVTSDQQLLEAIAQAAALTGRPELLDAPILVFGVSSGAPEASGFTARNPERVLGLFLKVPVPSAPFTGAALEVPVHMVLAQNDVIVNNAVLSANFATHRAAGAPWAMSVEPGAVHHSLSPAQRDLTVDWMRAMLQRAKADPFRGTWPQVGFKVDQATGQITPAGHPSAGTGLSSWFPTRSLAVQWTAFVGM